MKVNNRGLSVVELIVSFVLCILVFIFIIQVVSSIEELYINLGVKTQLLNKQSIISEQINNKFSNNKTILIKNCGSDCLTFFYKDNTSEKMRIDKEANNFIFGDDVYNFNGLGFVDSLTIAVNDDHTYNQGILTVNLNIANSIFDNGKYIIKALYQYNNSETVYSPESGDKAEIFLLGPAISYKFSEDLFIEPGWIVYYPSGKITINESDVIPSKIKFDSDGNGSIDYNGTGEAAGVTKTRMIKNYETAKDHFLRLYNPTNNELYYYEGVGKYVFKGSNPNNYLAIGSKLFRIISLDIQTQYLLDDDGNIIEVDGEKQKGTKYLLKVVSTDYIKDENNNELLPYSIAPGGTPLNNRSVWSTKVCVGDTCTYERQYINSVVNDIYLQSLLNTGSGRLQIKNGTFNVGILDWENDFVRLHISTANSSLVQSYSARDLYNIEGADSRWGDPGKWSGDCMNDVCGPNAGIISVTDVLFASSNSKCLDDIVVDNGVGCVLDNWLWVQKNDNRSEYRLMTRCNYTSTWLLTEQNYLNTQDIPISYKTRATLFLDADLYIMGSGTSDSPYVLYTTTKQ